MKKKNQDNFAEQYPRTAKRLLTLQAAADYMSLNVWSLRRLIWDGRIPIVRLSERRIRVDIHALDKALERLAETVEK